ncbi:MAG: STAS domain-containing protein [Desulfarculus sp.]|nr:MAG: STAS domain-containing protein [Desulfarculus sp.]
MLHRRHRDGYQISLQGPPGGAQTLRLSGRLNLQAMGHLLAQFKRVLEPTPPASLTVELSGVQYLDSGGALALNLLSEQAAQRQVPLKLEGLGPQGQQMLALVRPDRLAPPMPPPTPRPGNFIENLGVGALRLLDDLVEVVAFVGSLARALALVARRPSVLRWRDVELYMERVGVDGLPIVALISFLLGLIMAFMSAIQLKHFGANIYVADLVAVAMVRELGPIMTAVLVAGRSGSAFAAEIGTMVVNQEVDALKVMGFDITVFLAMPKIVAALLMVPLLILFSDLLAIVGGMIIGVTYLDLTVYSYVQHTLGALSVGAITSGALKGVVFAFLIGGIGCQRGLAVAGGAEGVGRATTSAVVAGMFLIVVADSIFAIVQYYL